MMNGILRKKCCGLSGLWAKSSRTGKGKHAPQNAAFGQCEFVNSISPFLVDSTVVVRVTGKGSSWILHYRIDQHFKK